MQVNLSHFWLNYPIKTTELFLHTLKVSEIQILHLIIVKTWSFTLEFLFCYCVWGKTNTTFPQDTSDTLIKDTADIYGWRNVRTFSLKKYFHIIYMLQWLIIHLYIHRTSVVKHLKQYKLTFFFFKLTLHVGKCKSALNVHAERCRPLWAAPVLLTWMYTAETKLSYWAWRAAFYKVLHKFPQWDFKETLSHKKLFFLLSWEQLCNPGIKR